MTSLFVNAFRQNKNCLKGCQQKTHLFGIQQVSKNIGLLFLYLFIHSFISINAIDTRNTYTYTHTYANTYNKYHCLSTVVTKKHCLMFLRSRLATKNPFLFIQQISADTIIIFLVLVVDITSLIFSCN